MIEIQMKDKKLVLEALEELMYKVALQLNDLKGGPMTKLRKELTRKQQNIERIQHYISISV